MAEQNYKQIYLGGHLHGKRVRENFPPGLPEIRTIPPQHITARDLVEPQSDIHEVHYKRSDASIFGAVVTFWICEYDWIDRDQLVRDFLLFPLEV